MCSRCENENANETRMRDYYRGSCCILDGWCTAPSPDNAAVRQGDIFYRLRHYCVICPSLYPGLIAFAQMAVYTLVLRILVFGFSDISKMASVSIMIRFVQITYLTIGFELSWAGAAARKYEQGVEGITTACNRAWARISRSTAPRRTSCPCFCIQTSRQPRRWRVFGGTLVALRCVWARLLGRAFRY